MNPMKRKVKLTSPSGSPDWKKGKKMIPELVKESEEDELLELIDPFSLEYGRDTWEEEGRVFAAEKILFEDLLVLQLDLENKRGYIEKTSDGYLIEDNDYDDPRTSFARANRLIHFCVLDDAVGFKWEFL